MLRVLFVRRYEVPAHSGGERLLHVMAMRLPADTTFWNVALVIAATHQPEKTVDLLPDQVEIMPTKQGG